MKMKKKERENGNDNRKAQAKERGIMTEKNRKIAIKHGLIIRIGITFKVM